MVGAGSGAIAGCHCSLLWFAGRVKRGSGRWTLLGAIEGCRCSVLWLGGGHFFFTLITQELVLLSGVYAGIILFLKLLKNHWNLYKQGCVNDTRAISSLPYQCERMSSEQCSNPD